MNNSIMKAINTNASKSNWRTFNIGLWFLIFASSVIGLEKTRWQIDAIYFSAPLLCAGMVLMLNFAFQNWERAIKTLTPFNRLVFWSLILWSVVIFLRGFSSFEVTDFRDNLGIRYFGWTWFVPIFMVLSMNSLFIPQLFKAMLKHGRLGLVILAIAWVPPIRLYSLFDLCWGCSALLIFWHYIDTGAKRISLIGAFLTVLFCVLSSQRSAIAGHGFLMVVSAYIAITRRSKLRGRRRFGVIICFLFIYGLVYYSANHTDLPFFGTHTETKVEAFKEELFQNTRVSSSGVSIYQDLLNDMDEIDLFFGRGSIGTYRSMESGGVSRPIIESGYFQIILKGGLIMLVLILLLAVPAALKGLFVSRNWLVKGFAFIVAGWLLEMIPYGVPAASPRYVFFWIAIGVCLNPAIRNMTDDEIERNVLSESAVSLRKGR